VGYADVCGAGAVKRQPRARTGSGGNAPSMKGKDPRANRAQPVVAEDTVRARALQRLEEIPSTATTAQVRDALNAIVRALKNEEKT
jgi:hypothetical protein